MSEPLKGRAPQSPGVEGETEKMFQANRKNVAFWLTNILRELSTEQLVKLHREIGERIPATPRKMTDDNALIDIITRRCGYNLFEDNANFAGTALLTVARAVRDYEGRGDGKDYKTLYEDLIYQVHSKIPGETRHETAKRIIYQHEHQDNAPQAVHGKGDPQ